MGGKRTKKSKCQSAVRDICRQWHIPHVFKRHHQEIQATESHHALIVRQTAGAFSQNSPPTASPPASVHPGGSATLSQTNYPERGLQDPPPASWHRR